MKPKRLAMETPTVIELKKYIGQEGHVVLMGLNVAVRILDARATFGRIDYRVEPLAGSLSVWLDRSRFVHAESVTIRPRRKGRRV